MADSESVAGLGDDIDPEDSWMPWVMRRREASDDEDSNGEDPSVRTSTRAFVGSDDDSDGAGRAPEDDDDDDGSYYSDDEEEVLFQEKEETESFSQGEEEHVQEQEEGKIENGDVAKQRREEEQKAEERETLIVPTGSFYMHDDRFESHRTLNQWRRLTFDRMNLRQFKDQEKWQHDKFEELENQRFNARTKVQTIYVPYNQGYSVKEGRDKDVKANWFKPNASYESHIAPARIVRGRGPVKYRPLNSHNDMVQPTRNKDLRNLPGANSKPFESRSGVYPPARNKEKLCGVNSNAYSDRADHNSSLPHERLRYPASSSNLNVSIAEKRDSQSGKVEGYYQKKAYHQGKGKSIADSSGKRRLNAKHSINPVSEHRFSTRSFQSSMPTYKGESSQSMNQTQTRNFSFPVPNAHQSPTFYNVDQVIPTNNNHALQQAPAGYTQWLSTDSGINSGTLSLSGTDLRTIEAFARPRVSETTLSEIETWINQGSRRGYQLAVQHRDQYMSDAQNDVHRALDRSVGSPNSGMTWMPALPDDVGFPSSHYVTPNDNPCMFSLGQESSTGIASNEADANKAFEGSLTADGTEDVKNQSGNQRSKFQRYSKMKFDPKA